jgi:hypothetical protein
MQNSNDENVGPALILRKGIHDFKRSEKLAIDLCLLLAENYRDLFGVSTLKAGIPSEQRYYSVMRHIFGSCLS